MAINQNNVVSINYTVKNNDGVVIDSSESREPLSFIHGKGMIIPALENALEGKDSGESLSVVVNPEEGYGNYDEAMIFTVPKEQFQDASALEEGSQVQVKDANGETRVLKVKNIEEKEITLDANHPLAGETLYFDITVEGVREATPEELDHGHVH